MDSFLGILIFWELKLSCNMNKKATIWVIFEKPGKDFNWARVEGTEKFDTVQPILSATEPSYLRGLVTNSKRRWFKRQCGSKQHTCIKKTCKYVLDKFSKKYITSNVHPTENAPYPTANRGTEHPNTPSVLVN